MWVLDCIVSSEKMKVNKKVHVIFKKKASYLVIYLTSIVEVYSFQT